MTKNEEFDSSSFPASEMGLSTPTEQQSPTRLIYANLWHRFVAACGDSGFVCNISLATLSLSCIMLNLSSQFLGGLEIFEVKKIFAFEEDQIPLFLLCSSVVGWLFFAMQESSEAQATFGEKAMRLKVVGLSGERISFGRATVRYFGRYISLLILFLGYGYISVWVFFLSYLIQPFTKKGQALHDLMAGTLVIKY